MGPVTEAGRNAHFRRVYLELRESLSGRRLRRNRE